VSVTPICEFIFFFIVIFSGNDSEEIDPYCMAQAGLPLVWVGPYVYYGEVCCKWQARPDSAEENRSGEKSIKNINETVNALPALPALLTNDETGDKGFHVRKGKRLFLSIFI